MLARRIVEEGKYTLAAVNDPCDVATSAYLFKYDSVHRQSRFDVTAEAGMLHADGKHIRYSTHETPGLIDFSDCDIVFECSGCYNTTESLTPHLRGRVKRVVLSAMPRDTMPVYVVGLSKKRVLEDSIISAGSCSTNALALILSAVEEHYPIMWGSVTSVHSYTTDQNIVDGKNAKGARIGRAAGLNIIPVATGVSRNLSFVLPHLADRFIGFSVRVPVANVSMLDITLSMQSSVTIDAINTVLRKAARERFSTLLDVDDEARVSSDFVSGGMSVTVATDLTQATGNNSVKIVGWFDNETGYTSRLYDLIHLLKETI
jgi:glyceraldehyde 3-phosphate dehydrogenase